MSSHLSTRRQDALQLFLFEPSPSKHGESAGSRSSEGLAFRDKMRELLRSPGTVVETAIAKSSDGIRVDGSASERISYKMLRFKRNPSNENTMLVIALNVAFKKYQNSQMAELEEQVAYLNGIDQRAPILILAQKTDYEQYIDRLEGLIES